MARTAYLTGSGRRLLTLSPVSQRYGDLLLRLKAPLSYETGMGCRTVISSLECDLLQRNRGSAVFVNFSPAKYDPWEIGDSPIPAEGDTGLRKNDAGAFNERIAGAGDLVTDSPKTSSAWSALPTEVY
jgi:hypothetical protein